MSTWVPIERLKEWAKVRFSERGSATTFSRESGLCDETLLAFLRGSRPPTDKLLSALGWTKQTFFRHISDEPSAASKVEPRQIMVKSRITWPTTKQKIGWGTEPNRVRFHFEDTFEVTDEHGKTKVVSKQRTEFVDIPVGGEIEIEGVIFQCRDLREREEHSKWERKILARGKRQG